MEIISYLKGKKSQREISDLHEVIGQDSFKNGNQDIVGTQVDAHSRISDLENKNKDRILSLDIESLTRFTSIELNKNILLTKSALNSSKLKLTNLEFNNFNSASDLLLTNRNNISINTSTGKIYPTNKALPANGLINHSIDGVVQLMTYSNVSTGRSAGVISLNELNYEMKNIEFVSGKFQLTKDDLTNFSDEGEIKINLSQLEEAFSWISFEKKSEVANNGMVTLSLYDELKNKIIPISEGEVYRNKNLILIMRFIPGKTVVVNNVVTATASSISLLQNKEAFVLKGGFIQFDKEHKEDFVINQELSTNEYTLLEIELDINSIEDFQLKEVTM